ncbi:MAG: GrpB family protein [Scytonema sp. PMC 1069.18]|nr:GrpB family protein [Scytonema sp. PMC 1069.18]MEC4888240.1 GrpB family protein [Scytonema sp. PMC 1070.18]
MRKIEVLPYNLKWRDAFAQEKQQILQVFGDNIVAIHHIGSTAIPNIYAKPIIDLLVEVKSLASIDGCNLSMEALGYEVMGEFGIPGRRFFRKNNTDGVRTHHVHAFEVGSKEVKQHLAFRDYMIVHREDAQKYSELKRELARKYPYDIDSYVDGKDEFIQQINEKAARWRELQKTD